MKRMIDPQNAMLGNTIVENLEAQSIEAENIYINGELQDTDGNDYIPVKDYSSGITNIANLTLLNAKIYNFGNLVFLSIFAKNETGSDIAANTSLFSVPTELKPPTNNVILVRSSGNNSSFVIYSSNGVVYNNDVIESNGSIFINAFYTIA